MEDLGFAEKVNSIGVDHLGMFSIYNKDNNSGNSIMDKTRLEKWNKLLELDHLSEVERE